MNNRVFKYPKSIQASKTYSKIMILLGVVLLPIILLNNKMSKFNSLAEYIFGILSVPAIMCLGSLIYICSWPDIEIDTDGVKVEFLWKNCFVPWGGIKAIKHVGSRNFGLTVVTTKKTYLTPFHRIYGLFTVYSFQPCFYIHSRFFRSHDVVKIIEKNMCSKSMPLNKSAPSNFE